MEGRNHLNLINGFWLHYVQWFHERLKGHVHIASLWLHIYYEWSQFDNNCIFCTFGIQRDGAFYLQLSVLISINISDLSTLVRCCMCMNAALTALKHLSGCRVQQFLLACHLVCTFI